jgi:nucleotide-binding universal stress UspA family protein
LPVILSRALQHIVHVDGVRVDGDTHDLGHLATWATCGTGWVGCSDGVDRSGPARAALGLAADVAAALGGSLMVMAVIEYVRLFPLGSDTAGTGASEAVAAARARLESAVSELRRRGLAVQVVVRSGKPASPPFEVADDIDANLVVLGTRGRGGPDDLMLGSVARTVADRVRRPTLVRRRLPARLGVQPWGRVPRASWACSLISA